MKRPIAAGKSSFELLEPDLLFPALHLTPKTVLVDVACGAGRFSLAAAEQIGPQGAVYAVDLWEEGLHRLQEAAAARGFSQIVPLVADVSQRLPLEDGRADVCLLASVLHDLQQVEAGEATLGEITRVLKPGGMLAVVEFKNIEGPPGPPRAIRLAPEVVEKLVVPHGFRRETLQEVGRYHYLLTFVAS